ncbi:MAG: hypothetical protein ICV64_06825 [Thermoleophilia bacterium]|nr:hypothetical protein [Thermoleophilia bacterium]
MRSRTPTGRAPGVRRRLALRAGALVVAAAGAMLLPGTARASHWQPGACGLPTSLPLQVEYAEVAVSPIIRTEIFGPARPPLVLATSGSTVPAELRAAGAHTIFWYMKLQRLVGSPREPADPATIREVAERVFARAVEQTGCATPKMAFNELFGAYLVPPWSVTNAQYRANVLALLTHLHALGAHPYLLVVTRPAPFTDTPDAAGWWRSVAEVSDIVLQVHFNGRYVAELGAIAGSRQRRTKMRRVVAQLEAAGVPTARLGLLHGFQSGRGSGGREGLPLSTWLRVVKWEALAAKQVAAERAALGKQLASDWSWGWGDFVALSPTDPDKPVTACVYLWTRDPVLCDGPARAAAAATRFNASLTEGQLVLPPGVDCTISPRESIFSAEVERLAAARTDTGALLGRKGALATLFARVLDRRRAAAWPAEVTRAEQAVVLRRFGGSWTAYTAALTERNLVAADAREIIADQVRRRKIGTQLRRQRTTYRRWAAEAAERVLRRTTCAGDQLPAAWRPVPGRVGFLRVY